VPRSTTPGPGWRACPATEPPADHGIDDAAEIWWDGSVEAEDERGVVGTGAWRRSAGGQRFTADEDPTPRPFAEAEGTRAMAEFSILVQRNEVSRARLQAQGRRLHEAVTALFEQQERELGIRFRLRPPALAVAVLELVQGFAIQAAFDDADSALVLPHALEALLAAEPGPEVEPPPRG
jgi:hypothetical protein